MPNRLFSIFDATLKVHFPPFQARAVPEAIRIVKQSFASPEAASSPVVMAPAEFDLVELGEIFEDSGEIVAKYTKICKVSEIICPNLTASSPS